MTNTTHVSVFSGQAHGRLNLCRKDFFNFLVVLFELHDGQEMSVEPFQIFRAAMLPIIVVVIEPVGAVKDGTVEPENCRVAFGKLNFYSNKIMRIKAGFNGGMNKLPLVQ